MAEKRSVDVAFVRIVAYKRIFTACASLVASVALVGIVASRAAAAEPRSLALTALALAIFLGGGSWSLRDGLRLVRELRAHAAARHGA